MENRRTYAVNFTKDIVIGQPTINGRNGVTFCDNWEQAQKQRDEYIKMGYTVTAIRSFYWWYNKDTYVTEMADVYDEWVA